MPCIYFGRNDDEYNAAIQNGSSTVGEVIHSMFFDNGNKLNKLGRKLLVLSFGCDCNCLLTRYIWKVRMILGCIDWKEDEFGYLVESNEYLGIVEVDLKESRMDCQELLSYFTFENKEHKKECISSKSSSQYTELITNHVICSVFEFISTKDLIESCSLVCKHWAEMILEDKDTTEQIFGNRFKNIAYNIDLDLDFELVREQHTNMNWMEIYMMSGMFHLEIDPNYQNWMKLTDISLTLLLLDPLIFLDLEPNHFLKERFRYYKRILIFSEHEGSHALELQRYKSKRFSDHHFNCSDPKITLGNILQSPVVFPLKGKIFSIDLESGIPVYLNFLKEISEKLSTIETSDAAIIATFLDLMLEKAHHFLEHFSIIKNYRVGVDVLIGLHLIFLDKYYLGDNLLVAPHLNFGRLLNNLNNNEGELFESYPEPLANDLLEELVVSLKQSNQTTWIPSPNSIFKHQLNAFEFLKEHIFELGAISEPISQLTKQYLQLIQKEETTFPSKHSDLILHFHLLHPQHYIHDCYRLHPNNVIKYHDFNFPYHHNPHYTFNYQLSEHGWIRRVEYSNSENQ